MMKKLMRGLPAALLASFLALLPGIVFGQGAKNPPAPPQFALPSGININMLGGSSSAIGSFWGPINGGGGSGQWEYFKSAQLSATMLEFFSDGLFNFDTMDGYQVALGYNARQPDQCEVINGGQGYVGGTDAIVWGDGTTGTTVTTATVNGVAGVITGCTITNKPAPFTNIANITTSTGWGANLNSFTRGTGVFGVPGDQMQGVDNRLTGAVPGTQPLFIGSCSDPYGVCSPGPNQSLGGRIRIWIVDGGGNDMTAGNSIGSISVVNGSPTATMTSGTIPIGVTPYEYFQIATTGCWPFGAFLTALPTNNSFTVNSNAACATGTFSGAISDGVVSQELTRIDKQIADYFLNNGRVEVRSIMRAQNDATCNAYSYASYACFVVSSNLHDFSDKLRDLELQRFNWRPAPQGGLAILNDSTALLQNSLTGVSNGNCAAWTATVSCVDNIHPTPLAAEILGTSELQALGPVGYGAYGPLRETSYAYVYDPFVASNADVGSNPVTFKCTLAVAATTCGSATLISQQPDGYVNGMLVNCYPNFAVGTTANLSGATLTMSNTSTNPTALTTAATALTCTADIYSPEMVGTGGTVTSPATGTAPTGYGIGWDVATGSVNNKATFTSVSSTGVTDAVYVPSGVSGWIANNGNQGTLTITTCTTCTGNNALAVGQCFYGTNVPSPPGAGGGTQTAAFYTCITAPGTGVGSTGTYIVNNPTAVASSGSPETLTFVSDILSMSAGCGTLTYGESPTSGFASNTYIVGPLTTCVGGVQKLQLSIYQGSVASASRTWQGTKMVVPTNGVATGQLAVGDTVAASGLTPEPITYESNSGGSAANYTLSGAGQAIGTVQITSATKAGIGTTTTTFSSTPTAASLPATGNIWTMVLNTTNGPVAPVASMNYPNINNVPAAIYTNTPSSIAISGGILTVNTCASCSANSLIQAGQLVSDKNVNIPPNIFIACSAGLGRCKSTSPSTWNGTALTGTGGTGTYLLSNAGNLTITAQAATIADEVEARCKVTISNVSNVLNMWFFLRDNDSTAEMQFANGTGPMATSALGYVVGNPNITQTAGTLQGTAHAGPMPVFGSETQLIAGMQVQGIPYATSTATVALSNCNITKWNQTYLDRSLLGMDRELRMAA